METDVATCATSGALASSRDALRAGSDLRAYGPCHRRDGTAGAPELLPQLPQPGLGTISDDYGPAATCRSMVLAAAARARATRMSRLRAHWAGDAAGGRGTERRRAKRRLRDRRERADASIRSTGRGEHCKSTRRGMCKFIGLTNRCSFLEEANRESVWGRSFECEHRILFR